MGPNNVHPVRLLLNPVVSVRVGGVGLRSNMACCCSEVDLGTVPLVALNMTFRKRLGLYLNPKNTVAADWTAFAEAIGFTYLEIKNYEASPNPTKSVLEDWQARSADATVGKLLSILTEVERLDIVEDLRPLIGASSEHL